MKKLLCIVLCIFTLFAFSSCKKKAEKHITENYGLCNAVINVQIDGDGVKTEFESKIEKAVPTKDVLTENLKKAGYTINESAPNLETDVQTERVYAVKGEHIIDFCYCETAEDAKKICDVFAAEHKAQKDFYIIAQNLDYAYFISDKTAFEDAGFTSLVNDGVQFICE